VSSQILMLRSSSQDDGIRRWGLWYMIRSGGWALMNGIHVLIKDSHGRLPCPFGHLRTQGDRAMSEEEALTNLPVPCSWSLQPPKL
jgi:hypothetical protein